MKNRSNESEILLNSLIGKTWEDAIDISKFNGYTLFNSLGDNHRNTKYPHITSISVVMSEGKIIKASLDL
jgi:hypothetical protein